MSVNLSDPKLYSLIDEDLRTSIYDDNSFNKMIKPSKNDVMFSQSTNKNKQVSFQEDKQNQASIDQASIDQASIDQASIDIIVSMNEEDLQKLEKQKRKEKMRKNIIIAAFCLVLLLCIFLTIRRWMLAWKICKNSTSKVDCAAALSPEISSIGFAAVTLL
jgi:hypothetical protein